MIAPSPASARPSIVSLCLVGTLSLGHSRRNNNTLHDHAQPSQHHSLMQVEVYMLRNYMDKPTPSKPTI